MARYKVRVWKALQPVAGLPAWNNEYYIETSETMGSEGLKERCRQICAAEEGITLPTAMILRADIGSNGPNGEIQSAEDFDSVAWLRRGTRQPVAPWAPAEAHLAVCVNKATATGKHGRQVYRYVMPTRELDESDPLTLRWNPSYWTWIHGYESFRNNMMWPGYNHLVARYSGESRIPVGYDAVIDWQIGSPIKLQSAMDAQGRKRPEGITAHGYLYGGLSLSSIAFHELQGLLSEYSEKIPLPRLIEPIGKIGAAILLGGEIDSYFQEFPAPLSAITRWSRPRPDPDRAQAQVSVTAWKALKEPYDTHMEQLQPEPGTNNVERSWVEGLRDGAKRVLFHANVASVSRYT